MQWYIHCYVYFTVIAIVIGNEPLTMINKRPLQVSSQHLSNQKSSESGNRDGIGVIAFSMIMPHPDAVPLLEVQHDHVSTSLVSCITITHRSDL